MSFAAIGAITAVASVGMGAYALATQPGAPKNPDLGAASRAATEAEAATLGDRRRLEAAARQGTSTTYQTAGQKDVVQERQMVRLPQLGGAVPYVKSEWETGGKYFNKYHGAKPNIYTSKVKVNIPAGEATADFTGYGEADVQGKVARDQAQNILDLNEKYGSQFIDEALKQQELADPEGTAARKKLYELIQQQAGEDPERPVADLLDSQVRDQLAGGRGLDRVSTEMLDEAIRQAGASRGETYGGADFADPLTTGFAGQSRLDAGQQKALGWLSSGATPEDVAYRRNQQTMANLADFTNNRTPQSQFASLSGAQQGAAPFAPGPAGPQNNGSAGQAAQGAALSSWNTQLQNNQADPWMAGLSMLLGAGNVAGQAGWKPLA